MFDAIYRIAIDSKSFEELKRRLRSLYIDVPTRKSGIPVTAGAQLAKEGRDDKVEWMRQLGANVSDIAYGYALAGNHVKVKYYHTQYGVNVDVIAHGYALAGNDEKVEYYHTKYSTDVDVDVIAHGYALAGNHEKVEAYRKQYNVAACHIAQSYAEAGNHERVEAYRKEYNVAACHIAQGYAKGGYHERVEAYRTQHNACVGIIAEGYAKVGNHERVEAYRTQHNACAGIIAEGYAKVGNHEKQKKYEIIFILDSYLKEREAVIDDAGRTKEYFHGSFFAVFQKSFTQKRKAVAALQDALDGNSVDLTGHLSTLRNGNLGKQLRAFVKAGKGKSLVGKEVNTVSDFVQALQDKNLRLQSNQPAH